MKIEQFLKEESPLLVSHEENQNELDKLIDILFQIIEALEVFKDNYHKKLNLTKLAEYLKLPSSHLEKIISLLMECQNRFNTTLKDHWIKPTLINNIIYLITEVKAKATPSSQIIHISSRERQLFNDYIYTFRFVKKGQGIPLQGRTSFLANLKQFYASHPYLFLKNGDGLLYPSEIGIKLGETLHSHLKCNKKINEIEIDPYHFIFEE